MLSVNPMSNQIQSLSFQGSKGKTAKNVLYYVDTLWGRRPVKDVKAVKVKAPTKIDAPKENIVDQTGMTWIKTKIWGEIPVKDAECVPVEKKTLIPKKTNKMNKKKIEAIERMNLNALMKKYEHDPIKQSAILRNYLATKWEGMNLFQKVKFFFQTLFTKVK